MKVGLSTSVALHSALLAWAILSLPGARETERPVVDALPVEFVPLGAETNLRLGDKSAKPKDEIVAKDAAKAEKDSEGKRAGTSKQEEPPPAPPEQKHAALPKEEPKPPTPKPPEVKPVAKPEPPKPEPPKAEPKKEPEPEKPKEAERAKDLGEGKKPEPKEPPKDQKAVDKLIEKAEKEAPKKEPPKKEPEKKVDPVKTAAVQPTAPAKPAPTAATASTAPSTTKSSFDAKDISAILNKNATGTSASANAPRTASLGSVTGKNSAVKMTQNEVDALIGQIKKCWNPPIGSAEAHIKVTMRFALNQDGTVNGRPSAIEAPAHPLGPSLARSAERAILQCGPYRLPADKYSAWADVVADFNPNDL